MFNFAGIAHVIANPQGHAEGWNYSLVGSVPTTMLEQRKATVSDVMGGRAKDGFAWHGRKWESVAEILSAASEHGVTMCATETCACRKLF